MQGALYSGEDLLSTLYLFKKGIGYLAYCTIYNVNRWGQDPPYGVSALLGNVLVHNGIVNTVIRRGMLL